MKQLPGDNPTRIYPRPVNRRIETFPVPQSSRPPQDRPPPSQPVHTSIRKTYKITVDCPDWLSVVVLPVTISLTCVVLLTLYFGVKESAPRIYIDQQGNVYQLR